MILFRTAAALALFCLQETPQDWIRQLGSEDAKVRDRASSRLLDDGEKSRALLEKAGDDKDPEISQRARILIRRLDARKILPACTGELGKSGGFWIAKEAFALLADDDNVPEGMKSLLHREAEATFAMVLVGGAKARLVDIVTARVTPPTQEQAERYGHLIFDEAEMRPRLFRHFVHGPMDSGTEVNNQPQIWDYGWEYAILPFGDWWKAAPGRRPADLFRSWPDLRAASIVFVAPSNMGKSLQKALLEALSHARSDVRLAATAALGRYFTVASVEGLLARLGDSDAGVVETAGDTLRKLADAPKGSAADVQKWWSAMKEADRKLVLMKGLSDCTHARPPDDFSRARGDR